MKTWLGIMALLFLLGMCGGPSHGAPRDAAVGDSIALGTGHALRVPTYARSGASSCWVARRTPRGPFDHVVVSAGINDGGVCVRQVRARIIARRVTWIIPADINGAALVVWNVVKQYGDGWVLYACRRGCSRVNFHPASYSAVARAVRRDWRTHP